MRPKIIELTADALDADGYVTTVTPSVAGALTLGGDLCTSGVGLPDIARHVAITGGSNESGDTFTIVGTDRQDRVITEALAGPNAGVVSSVNNYKTVTSITTDGAATGAITIGTDGEFDSQIVPVNSYADNISYSVELSSDKNLTYEFKYTLSDIFAVGFLEAAAIWFSDLGPKTVNSNSVSAGPFRACRLEITDFEAGTIVWNIVTAANR